MVTSVADLQDQIIGYLRKHDNQASLQDIAKFIGMRNYGDPSAYRELQKLVKAGLLEKSGSSFSLKQGKGKRPGKKTGTKQGKGRGARVARDSKPAAREETGEIDMDEIDQLLASVESDQAGASKGPARTEAPAPETTPATPASSNPASQTSTPSPASTGLADTPSVARALQAQPGQSPAEQLGQLLLNLLKQPGDLEQVLHGDDTGEDEYTTYYGSAAAEEGDEVNFSAYLITPADDLSAEKQITPLETGTLVDALFRDETGEPLNGVPQVGQFGITGTPGSGKSLLVHEMLVHFAKRGKKVVFITTEEQWETATARFDLQSRVYQKAELLNVPWEAVTANVTVLDLIARPELREWDKLYATYKYILDSQPVDVLIFDSVTILDTRRYRLKFRVMELARLNQVEGITAFFVNQRSKHRWDSYDVAGGIGIPHALDGNISIDHGRVSRLDQRVDLGAPRGMPLRILRVLDCRLCDFDPDPAWITINRHGFVRPISIEERAALLQNYRTRVDKARVTPKQKKKARAEAILEDYERARERGDPTDSLEGDLDDLMSGFGIDEDADEDEDVDEDVDGDGDDAGAHEGDVGDDSGDSADAGASSSVKKDGKPALKRKKKVPKFRRQV